MTLSEKLTAPLDGAWQVLGDGFPRKRHLRVQGYFPTPVWVRPDHSIARSLYLETLPQDIVLVVGRVEVLSGDPFPPAVGTQYYVATNGSSSNAGDIANPWTLSFALAGAGGKLKPGDTVWIRGGTYVGNFGPTGPNGTPTARITFRQFGGDAPLGERVIIDGQFQMKRAWWDLRGIEIFKSNPVSNTISNCILGSDTQDTKGSRVINVISHDAGETGFTGWLNARGSMYYGCISYNNGTHHNKDHGYYIHDSEKAVVNCIAFNNLARGFQLYDSKHDQRHMAVRQCISFGNGTISANATVIADSNYTVRVLSPRVQEDILLDQCVSFHNFDTGKSRGFRLGTDGNLLNQLSATIRGCYAWRAEHLVEIAEWQDLTFEDNVLVNAASGGDIIILKAPGLLRTSWERNAWYLDPTLSEWEYLFNRTFQQFKDALALGYTDTASAATPPDRVFVFPNEFEPGRAHVAIFNHSSSSTIPVDLSAVLKVGDSYQIRNVQDLWGTPLHSGTYGGGTVSVTMAGIAGPTPGGAGRSFTTPPVTGPSFQAFLVLKV